MIVAIPRITASCHARRAWRGSARELLLAFGGKSNIRGIDAAITRLHIEVAAIDQANPAKLKALAAAAVQGILRLPDNVPHLLPGLNADQYAAEIKAVMAG